MSANTGQTEQHKKDVLEALSLSLGVVTTACRKANVGRTQFYEWLSVDTAFAESVQLVKEEALDLVESKLFQTINGFRLPDVAVTNYRGVVSLTEHERHYPPNVASIIFYLKTQGKKRGYIEKQEIDINTKSEVQTMLENLDQLDDTQLKDLAKLTAKLGNSNGTGEAKLS